ncbi:MAG: hypothetical protein AMXMBFR53_06730 [Gemmatimonadota bacterium]
MRRGAVGSLQALGLVVAVWPRAAAAQEPPVLRATEPPPISGRVVSEDARHPVGRIRLNFAYGLTALTDDDGAFSVRGLPAGRHTVTLVTPACRTVAATFMWDASAPGELELVLPDAMARMDLGPDFEEGQGELATADDIARMRARTLTDVIRRMAPEMVDATPNQPGEAARLKGRNTATAGGFVEPVVVLDGLPQVGAAQLLRDIRPDEVAAVQVMSGAAGGWMYGSSGGMIRIWTKRGRGGGAVGAPSSCPAYAGPGGRS